MGNNFEEESSIVALWSLESGAVEVDSSGNGNNLVKANPTLDTSNKKVGAGSADFEADGQQYLCLEDSLLDAGFPCKNGDANKKFSFSVWVKMENGPGFWNSRTIMSKGWWQGQFIRKKSFQIGLYQNGLSLQQFMNIGYDAGNSFETVLNDTFALAADTWYHLFFSFDDSDKSYQMMVTEVNGTEHYKSGNFTNNLNVEDGALLVGAYFPWESHWDGNLDDLVVWNDVLSRAAAGTVFAGTYDYEASGSSCVARWTFDTSALGTDSIGNNNLKWGTPEPDTSDYKEKAASGIFRQDCGNRLWITDANLSSNFPGKNSNTNYEHSIMFWFKPTSLYLAYLAYTSFLVKESWQLWWQVSWYCGFLTDVLSDVYFGWSFAAGEVNRIRPSAPFAINQWYHIGLSYDGSSNYVMRLYDATNDEVITVTGSGKTFVSSGDHFWIGRYNAPVKMDEIIITSRAFTVDEIDKVRRGEFGLLPDLETWPLDLANFAWPKRYDYPQGILTNPTITDPGMDGRSLFRSGYEPIHRTWSFVLRHLTHTQKVSLEEFQETIGIGAEPFYWSDTRPVSASGAGGGSGGTYIVQLSQPMVFDLDDDGESYQTEVSLIEYCG